MHNITEHISLLYPVSNSSPLVLFASSTFGFLLTYKLFEARQMTRQLRNLKVVNCSSCL